MKIGKRRKLPLEEPARAVVLAEMIDEDHLAARRADALKLAHHALRVRHDRHHIHGGHGVEALVREGERARVHLVEARDIAELLARDPPARLFQHFG